MEENKDITILIVDDEPDNLQNIVDAFHVSKLNYRVLKALNALDAVKIAEKRLPDMIITDWDMPGMNGIEFIKQVRLMDSTADIPIIMCTGVMTTSDNLRTALEAGASDYIRKPVDRIELIARTSSMLQLGATIKQLKKSYEKIDQIARIDPLTQLSNRRDFLDKFVHEKAAADRNNKPFVLALGDIDHFKKFNDRHGHDCGDFVLTNLAKIFKETVRKQDYVGRWGGEEFIFMFPDTKIDGGRIIAEKVRMAIADRIHQFKELSLNISITIGLCEYDPAENFDWHLKRADIALYKGKEAGRNRVMVFENN